MIESLFDRCSLSLFQQTVSSLWAGLCLFVLTTVFHYLTGDNLIGKDPDAGKDRRQEEKGTTEEEMVGWPHRLDGLEFE